MALNKISPEATKKEIVPFLISRIKEPRSPWHLSMTIETLVQMTNQLDLAIPTLVDALNSTGNYTNMIIYELGHFGPAAKAAVPQLVAFSTGKDTNLCRLATNALDKIDPAWRTGH